MQRIHNSMLRARIDTLNGLSSEADEQVAFGLLRDTVLAPIYQRKSRPKLNVYSDQIVWGRSPVRIDISGGWTDTPPFSLLKGGNVVNLAIELNGQPPLQVYIKLSPGTSREAGGAPCLNPRRGLTLLSPVCRDPAIGV